MRVRNLMPLWLALPGLLLSQPLYAAVDDLAVSDLQQVSARRVGRAEIEFVYSVTISNAGGPLQNVLATVSSTTPATVIVDGSVTFGDIDSGAATSSDTITFRQNRRFSFSTTNLVWQFSGEEAAANTPPVAAAGADQAVETGSVVNLDGSSSSDADGDALSFIWQLSVPPGSAAAMVGADTANPSFTADVAGSYTASLTVSDGVASATDAVLITASTPNSAPVANAGSDQSVGTGSLVQLDGTGSLDIDGDVLSYAWALSVPAGSTATLSDAASPTPTFAADVSGAYVATLVVSDGQFNSIADSVNISVQAANAPPVAAAGVDRSVAVGARVQLDGSGSFDADGDALTFAWMLEVPMGSAAVLSAADTPTPEFTADVAGTFIVTLVVSDGQLTSVPDVAIITAASDNGAPVALDDRYTGVGGQQLTIAAPGVLENDSDPDGDVLSAVLVDAPTGALTLNVDGSFDYQPPGLPGPDGASRPFVTNQNLSVLAVPSFNPAFGQLLGFPERAADGDLDTSFAAPGGLGSLDYLEQIFAAEDIAVREVRVFNNRQHSGYAEPTEATLQLFDRAGNELYNSGPVVLPAPQRDFVFVVDPLVTDVYRVRYEITAFTGPGVQLSALAEMQVFGDGFVQQLPLGIEWSWDGEGGDFPTYENVLNTPLVIDLDGDEVPEVVFAGTLRTGAVQNPGFLRALNGEDGSEFWTTSFCVDATTTMAAADIDDDGMPEIIASKAGRSGDVCTGSSNGKRFQIFEHDGSLKLESEPAQGAGAWSGFTVADIDADGTPEIIWGRQVFNADGTLRWTGSVAFLGNAVPIASDVDLDGQLEVITGGGVYDTDGSLLFSYAAGATFTAIGNFDDDPYPEIFLNGGAWRLLEHDGSEKWRVFGGSGGGPPTVGDFDGDGRAEVGISRAADYAVVDDDGVILWTARIRDGSSGVTGSSLFDFDNDGRVEVVQSDEEYFRVWDGATGNVRFRMRATSVTAHEYPLVADVDGDGEAEIVLPASFRTAEESGALNAGVHVLGNTGAAPFVRARPIWNQHGYHVTNVLTDGRVPVNEPENWLLARLNNYRVNGFLPQDEEQFDRFTYRAADGAQTSEPATVLLDIAPATAPPGFITTPIEIATVDFEYFYNAQAVDPNGDLLTFSLALAPAGMAIDAATGLVRWTPTAADIGSTSVVVQVQDTDGLRDAQAYVLQVATAVIVPDTVGLTETAAAAALADVNLRVGQVTRVNDAAAAVGEVLAQNPPAGAEAANGSSVDLVVSLGPSAADLDDDGDGFTENQGDCDDGDAAVNPGATDVPGDGIDQDCSGSDAAVAPAAIVITPGSATLLTGQSVALTATGVDADGTSRDLTADVDWSNGGSIFDAAVAGTFEVTASIGAISGSATFVVVDSVEGDTALPFAELTTPASGVSVTAPVDVIGSATDANLLKYTLAIAPAGSSDFTVIAEDTSPVSDSVLGQLDPTLLLNDTYTLRLTVFDAGGNAAFTETQVVVEEDLKVGNFSVSFTDLAVPMSGLPISVTRTYDSRDKRIGDFGYGWRLDVNTLKVNSTDLANGWQVVDAGLFSVALVEDAAHTVSLTLPGGRVEKFRMRVNPDATAFSFAGSLQVSFEPLPGTLGTLASLDNNFVFVLGNQPGIVTLVDDLDLGNYDPDRYQYTAADGTRIVLSKADGVQSITEPSGNTLTFGADGIVHSAGKSVSFARDAEGRITAITDPGGNVQTYAYDANGDLVMHTDQSGFETKYAYNRQHGLLRIVDPLDRVVSRTEYDDDGRIVSITNADGRVLNFSRDIDGRQEIITDADGNTTVMTYDDLGNVLQVADPLGGITTNTYDLQGNPLTTTNAAGETTSRTFDARNNLLSETNAAGETTSFAYDASDNVTLVTDPLGRTTQLAYDGANRLTQRINALGVVEEALTYDTSGNVVTRTNANGATITYEYDGFGNQTAVVDAAGNRSETTYDANGAILTETDAEGTTVTTTVDGRGLFTSKTDPLGNTSTFTFNATGVLTGAADALGQATALEIDANGKDLAFTDALGNTVSKSYDILGNLTGVTNALGNTVSYEYDALSRRIRTVNPDGGNSAVEYDPAGRVIRQTDALGNVTIFEYDLAGRNTRRTDALGNSTTFVYDAAGNLISQTDALGLVFSFQYDALNRLTRTTYPDGTRTDTAYDSAGNVLTETDALGRVTAYAYDANNNLLAVTEPGGAVTTFTYDGNNNRLTQTDALGRTTTFEYDLNGRRVTKTYPDGVQETLGYDEAGRVDAMTDPNGDTTVNSHDANGQVTRKVFADGTVETMTYTATGQLASVSNDAAGITRYVYDTLDRLQRITYPDGSVVSYAYDLAGNRTAVTNSVLAGPGDTTTYTYDELNRISRVIEADGDTTTYTYDAIGNLATKSHPNGVVSTFTYDSLSRLINLRHVRGTNVIAEYDYTVNAVGDRTRIDHADGSRVEYTYDNRRRLTEESHIDAFDTVTFRRTYTYDAVGNRLSHVDLGGNTVIYAYNDNDQLTSAGAATYAYDANGNLQSRSDSSGTTAYTFDRENQLTRVTTPTQIVDYTYDGAGTRLSRSVNAARTNFLVDLNSPTGVRQVLSDYTDAGARLADYTYGFELLGQNRSGTEQRYHRDGSLNVRALTDDAGNTTDSYDYDAFGNVIAATGGSTNPYGFATDRYGAEEGLTYLRARYYDPQSGRFVSRDPFEGVLRDPVSLHRYLYTNANPITNTDPTGELSLSAKIAITLVIVDITLDVVSNVAGGKSGGEIFVSALITGTLSAATGSARFATLVGKSSVFLGTKLVSKLAGRVGLRFVIPAFQALGDTIAWYVGEVAKFANSAAFGSLSGKAAPGTLNIVERGISVFLGNFVVRLFPFGPVLKRFEEDVLARIPGISPDRIKKLATGNLFAQLASGQGVVATYQKAGGVTRRVLEVSEQAFARTALESLSERFGDISKDLFKYHELFPVMSFLFAKMDTIIQSAASSGG